MTQRTNAYEKPPDRFQDENAVSSTIKCEGVSNIRDLGKIKLANGRSIKPNRLIRSGKLHDATKNDGRILIEEHNLSHIIDLRTPSEVRMSPDNLEAFPNVSYENIPLVPDTEIGLVRDVNLATGALMAGALVLNPEGEMERMYERTVLSESGIDAIKEVFSVIYGNGKDKDSAVLWHCSVGKDRVGIITTLVLHALGAEDKILIPEYMETNRCIGQASPEKKRQRPTGPISQLRYVLVTVNSANEKFLNRAMNAIEREYGGMDGYLERAIGLDKDAIVELRRMYTAPTWLVEDD